MVIFVYLRCVIQEANSLVSSHNQVVTEKLDATLVYGSIIENSGVSKQINNLLYCIKKI